MEENGDNRLVAMIKKQLLFAIMLNFAIKIYRLNENSDLLEKHRRISKIVQQHLATSDLNSVRQ